MARDPPLLVVFLRPFSIDPVDAANSRQSRESDMAHVLESNQANRRTFDGTIAAPPRATAIRTKEKS
jgi:hypothetical protein